MQSGFIKRATYTLPVTAGVETNLNFRFEIAYEAEMNLDFSDIRFYDADDVTLIKHDRFSYTSGVSAIFWVKVPSKLAAGQSIYMYYGNSLLTDVSDPANVYTDYDDFSGTLSDKWTTAAPLVWYISEGVLRGKPPTSSGGYLTLNSITSSLMGYGFFARVKHDYPSGVFYDMGVFNNTNKVEYFRIGSGDTCTWSDNYATAHFGNNVWGNIEIRLYSTSNCKHFRNGVLDYTDVSGAGGNSFRFSASNTTEGNGFYCAYVYLFKLPSDGSEIADFTVPDIVEDVTPPSPEMDLLQGVDATASGGSYDFGSKTTDTNTDIIFTVTNSGEVDLNITIPLSITGANADQFSVYAQPTTPVIGGESTTFTIRFTPTSSGVKAAQIDIVNDDTDENPYVLNLEGTGVDPLGIRIVPTLVTFLEPKFHTNISSQSKFKKFFKNRSTKKAERFKLEYQGITDANFKIIYDFYRTHYGGAKKFLWENEYVPNYVLSILSLTTEDLTVRFEEGSLSYTIRPNGYDVEITVERDTNS